ncbi:MAG: DUF72 domain-containing protein [candidate division KSB1 bacterium]|nr:DUF72 domain-containing protein [candidate division KSB1 bacterium]MDZ7274270.1 DUF72 domain-containing protein [candidate division KSB1 bacterium]MDZ7287208.1 DUF72 domain-containing protein [candidate division KSB1 bacterium]MDZ7296867.1 DUF72 domain-containing protein [candidate division KSB1 bacterium]MDZ7306028.1 DUF72 domain-containing protein [candidate division KSB1 bacterium]
MKAQFLVGTSGWTYPEWQGVFYPEDWPKRRWFEYYAGKFAAVEVNATFYRTFKDQTYHKWREQAPAAFRYVLKVPRVVTHRKRLKEVEAEIKNFWRSASLLEDKLGLLLLQLAPGMTYDPERLKTALLTFGDAGKVAVEFRDHRWLTGEVKDVLKETGAIFCAVDSPKSRPVDWVTAEVAYIRLHGRQRWYNYDYSTGELREIAALAGRLVESGAGTVYIFFNNSVHGYAAQNALALQTMLR